MKRLITLLVFAILCSYMAPAQCVPSVSFTTSGSHCTCLPFFETVTAIPVYGGTAPTYQWYRNGAPQATTASTTLLINSYTDTVWVEMTSNAPCATITVVRSAPFFLQSPMVHIDSLHIYRGCGCDTISYHLSSRAIASITFLSGGGSSSSPIFQSQAINQSNPCQIAFETFNVIYCGGGTDSIRPGIVAQDANNLCSINYDSLILLFIDTPVITWLTKSICTGPYMYHGHSLTQSGMYADTFARVGHCDSIVILNLTVGTSIHQSLCLVTIDSATNSPIVAWEKANKYATDSFFIYRTTTPSTVYTRVAAIGRDSLSVWIDTSGHGGAMSYRYKITTKDTCGSTDSLSGYHQTIYLTALGSGSFSWTPYVIENDTVPTATYDFYRDSLGNGNWQLLSSVPTTQLAFIDSHYASFPNAEYKVVITLANPCNPSRVMTSISSNILLHPNRNVGIEDMNATTLIQLQPNPVHDILTITASEQAAIIITNSIGQVVYHSATRSNTMAIDCHVWQSGLYLYQIETERQTYRGKIIKE